MTPEQKAREIARLFGNRFDYAYEIDAFEIKIATALRDARIAALEEAAGVAEQFEDNGRDEYSAGADYAARQITARIRALKDKPEVTEEGGA